jgi:hypothetical protein
MAERETCFALGFCLVSEACDEFGRWLEQRTPLSWDEEAAAECAHALKALVALTNEPMPTESRALLIRYALLQCRRHLDQARVPPNAWDALLAPLAPSV